MATIASYLRRPTAIMKMPQAIAQGLTPTAFLRKLKVQGLGYRKQRFLLDWHNVSGTEKRKDAFKYVRRDRRPPMKAIAEVSWEGKFDWMYKVRTFVRGEEGGPLEERFVNVTSKESMTPLEVEAATREMWSDEQDSTPGELDRAQVVAGWHNMTPGGVAR